MPEMQGWMQKLHSPQQVPGLQSGVLLQPSNLGMCEKVPGCHLFTQHVMCSLRLGLHFLLLLYLVPPVCRPGILVQWQVRLPLPERDNSQPQQALHPMRSRLQRVLGTKRQLRLLPEWLCPGFRLLHEYLPGEHLPELDQPVPELQQLGAELQVRPVLRGRH